MPSTLGRSLLILLMLVMCVVSWQWIEDHQVQPVEERVDTIKMSETRGDYYLEDFEIVNIANKVDNSNVNGNQSSGDSQARAITNTGGIAVMPADRQLTITGHSLVHLYGEGSSVIDQPSVRLLSTGSGLWHATASTGRISANFDKLDLQGNVELMHNRHPDNPPINVNTESVSIDTANQTINSNDSVEVLGEGWQHRARSMNADIGNGILSFTSGVEAQFESPNSK